MCYPQSIMVLSVSQLLGQVWLKSAKVTQGHMVTVAEVLKGMTLQFSFF